MRVEKGIPRNPPKYDDTHPQASVSIETSRAGEGAREHGAGLMDEEAGADEDLDEDINTGDGDLPPVTVPSVILGTADKPDGQGALMGQVR